MSTASRRMRHRKVRAETTAKGTSHSTRPSPMPDPGVTWWVRLVPALGRSRGKKREKRMNARHTPSCGQRPQGKRQNGHIIEMKLEEVDAILYSGITAKLKRNVNSYYMGKSGLDLRESF